MSSLEDFTPYIEEAMKSWHCPGTAVAIVKEDELLYQKVFGLRNVEEELPLTADTRFPMASVTKSFTAMSVALLVHVLHGRLPGRKSQWPALGRLCPGTYLRSSGHDRFQLSARTTLGRPDNGPWLSRRLG